MSLTDKIRKLRDLLKFDNALQLLLNRTFFGSTSLTVYRYKGVTALVDHALGDQDGVKSCLVPGLYDPFLEAMRPHLTVPVSFLDLGANTGGFPLTLLAHGLPIRKGVSVELNPRTCTRLAVNLAQNGLSGSVQIVNAAICGAGGELSVRLSEGSVSDSIIFAPDQGTEITVKAVTIDEVITRHFPTEGAIDMCKIDIEGAEYGVLDQPTHGLLRRCRWIVIEIHAVVGRSAAEVKNRLAELGFEEALPATRAVEDNVFLFRRAAETD